MKRYRSHKVVEAGPIRGWGSSAEPGTLVVDLDDGGSGGIGTKVIAPCSIFARGDPARGDYLVRYDDGYLSWSPKAAFEAGYSEIV